MTKRDKSEDLVEVVDSTEEVTETKKKKSFSFSAFLAYAACAVAIVFVLFTLNKLLNTPDDYEKKTSSLFGHNFFVILSGSMEEELPVGSLIMTEKVDPSTLKVGDIISFVSIDDAFKDEIVTHKIRSIGQHEGELAFETYGIATGASDSAPALASKVLGKHQLTIPELGRAVIFIQGERGFLIIIIIPLAILFVIQIIKLIKALTAKVDDDEEDEKQNEEIEEEQKIEE